MPRVVAAFVVRVPPPLQVLLDLARVGVRVGVEVGVRVRARVRVRVRARARDRDRDRVRARVACCCCGESGGLFFSSWLGLRVRVR